MSDLVLFYWVRGRPLDDWGTIKVSPGTTIMELKAIMELKEPIVKLRALLEGQSTIRFYKIPEDKSVPYGDSMEDILGRLSISMLGRPLLGVRQLSEYFEPSIRQDQLHLVIVPDLLFVRCWHRGTEGGESFMVKALMDDHVELLKNAVKADLSMVRPDVPRNFMKLYKILVTDNFHLTDILATAGMGQLLQGDQLLGTFFNDVPFSALPSVVVEWFDDLYSHTFTGLLRKRKTSDREEAVYDLAEGAKRAKIANESPSLVSKPSNYRNLYKDPGNRIIDHRHLYQEHTFGNKRPHPNDEPPPISLQYEGFGHFLDIFHGREDVPGMEHVSSARLISAVDDFADLMSQVFADEATRRVRGLAALNDILSARTDNLSWQLMAAASQNSISDGHFLGSHHAACCVIEFKNEQGDVSSIPYAQMTSYFAHSIKAALENPFLVNLIKGWNIPCLGLTIVGQYITFYAIIYFGRWRVVSITPGLSCISESGQGADRILLYAAFKAASVFLAHVTKDVTTLVYNPPPEIRGSRALPYISSLSHPHSGTRVQFKIHSRIFHDKATDRELYLAQTSDEKVVVVKFSRRYSPELHAFCADRGCAPALLGFERLPGGFFGIAMEFVEPAYPLTQSPHVEKHREWVKLLRELVQSFHDQDLVHGDLRSPNIICDGNRVMIIDFDWAGKFGEAFYPDAQLNPDLMDGRDSSDRKITKDDDLRILDRTLDCVLLGK